MDSSNAGEGFRDSSQHSCSQCGAMIHYEPGTSSLKCPYCGHESAIAPATVQVNEQDYREYLAKLQTHKPSQESQTVKCGKCGAETTMPEHAAADFCPFCGASMVFMEGCSRRIKPEGLLPFKISRQAAFETFRRWIHGLWFAPGDLKHFARTDSRLAGVYIPYWTYDSSTATDYQGERGEYYYTHESYVTRVNGSMVTRSRQVRHTRWSPASGSVACAFDDVLVPAGKSLPQKYVDLLTPWDLENLQPYADAYVSGFRSETYQLDLPEGFEAAQRIMAPAIEAEIRRAIGGDEQRIHSASTRYDTITFKHILLPVWMSAYRFREKVYRIIINARTGEVQGERPYSAWKIAAAAAAGLIVLGILILIGASR